jgi:type III secretory pathway component EscV
VKNILTGASQVSYIKGVVVVRLYLLISAGCVHGFPLISYNFIKILIPVGCGAFSGRFDDIYSAYIARIARVP